MTAEPTPAPPTDARIFRLLRGGVAPLGPRGVPSGIAKQPAREPVRLGPEGLEGDEVGDRRHHGGPEKALHHYAFDHYAYWRSVLDPTPTVLDAPGAFGENLSTRGADGETAMTEETVCVGDVYRIGDALVQVSQGRQPCFKLNLRFGATDMALRVQTCGRTGWYYRVLEPGTLWEGAPIRLLERPRPTWPLARVADLLYRRPLALEELEELASLPELALSWRRLAARRIETRSVESWRERLGGE
ncbi:MOSC domain-containing protein [Microvirga thermotolerans]|uniref:MOSC domain-containing protein n=1 Tax=Microvirga thermotolerans TaxID=2651334 RepID=A0A5P9JTN3_9HYPH|nr:MOSC domain-containing protein [Microvirga thermotolerans]QFU15987.1 MOSC domain-containing protein [Microvirga thermotolerans]